VSQRIADLAGFTDRSEMALPQTKGGASPTRLQHTFKLYILYINEGYEN